MDSRSLDSLPPALAHAAFAAAAQPMLLCDAQGRVRYVNPAAQSLLGEGVLSADRPLLNEDDFAAAAPHRRRLDWPDDPALEVELVIVALPAQAELPWLVEVHDQRERLRYQSVLQRRLDFERRVVAVSAALMRAERQGLDLCIEQCLGEVGRFFGVDRAYVFRIADDGSAMSNSHEWVAAGISREADNLQSVPIDTFPWLMQQFRDDRSIHVPKVSELPPEAAAERAEFEREGIRSVVLTPMRLGAQLWGFAGFDAVRGEMDWTEDFELGLRLMAKMVVSSLQSRELADRLTELAFHDSLTGLANRKLLHDRLDQAHARARRNGGSISVLLIDVDDFKRVNDQLGHAVGDMLLREVATRLQQLVRDSDTVARLGGDEFVLLLDDAEQDEAVQVARRALAAFAAPLPLQERRLSVHLSIGLVHARAGAMEPEQLLQAADQAMYAAKAEGKNRLKLFRASQPAAATESAASD